MNTTRIVRVDNAGRVELRGIVEPRRHYQVSVHEDGRILLTPLSGEGVRRGKEPGRHDEGAMQSV